MSQFVNRKLIYKQRTLKASIIENPCYSKRWESVALKANQFSRTNQNNKTRHICTNSIRNSCILLQKTNKTWNSTHKHLLRQTRRLCSLRDLWLTFAHLLFLGCCCCKHSNHRLHHKWWSNSWIKMVVVLLLKSPILLSKHWLLRRIIFRWSHTIVSYFLHNFSVFCTFSL